MIFNWDEGKNQLLLKHRNICFENVVVSINNNKLLGVEKNTSKNFNNQYCLIVEISGYAYVVPFVKNENDYFLKTIFPSRKQTKKYLRSKK
ncbi:MAG: BrnT family toxin [Candidatus Thioglobus sp.]|nr:BrnT family toxin [Candidatus Thioglobus sp.]